MKMTTNFENLGTAIKKKKMDFSDRNQVEVLYFTLGILNGVSLRSHNS